MPYDAGSGFGSSIGVTDGEVWVGAPGANAIYVFQRGSEPGEWSGTYKITASAPGVSGLAASLGLLALLVSGCSSAEPAPAAELAPLILISLDGFRWDYPELADTPGLDRLIAAGVRAEGMIPVFPSKTFPSHYSIVTGLHPGHHAIISNNMRDPRWPEPFGLSERDQVNNPRWWDGEPIWVTAQKHGLRTAVYFWPGSEAPIHGMQADVWVPYDDSVTWEHRVDTALGWLELPAGERPDFVALYFEEPNSAGHRYGPEAAEALAAATAVDAAVGRLLEGLAAHGTLESTNIVVVSDHGMAQNAEERLIVIDDYIDLSREELFEFGALLQIFPASQVGQHVLGNIDHFPFLNIHDSAPLFHWNPGPALFYCVSDFVSDALTGRILETP